MFKIKTRTLVIIFSSNDEWLKARHLIKKHSFRPGPFLSYITTIVDEGLGDYVQDSIIEDFESENILFDLKIFEQELQIN